MREEKGNDVKHGIVTVIQENDDHYGALVCRCGAIILTARDSDWGWETDAHRWETDAQQHVREGNAEQ